MSEANELREMSRRLAEIAMLVPRPSDKFISDVHAAYNALEMFADEIEGKKTSLVVARQKGNVR